MKNAMNSLNFISYNECKIKNAKAEGGSLIGQDPFLIKKIAEYEIIEFLPTNRIILNFIIQPQKHETLLNRHKQ